MEVVKQRNEWDCLVATCQMITGCEYEECAKAIWDGQSYSTVKMIQFAVSKGYMVGIRGFDLRETSEMPEELSITREDVLNMPAYVSVQSNRDPNHTHAVYWDTEYICDPSYGSKEPLERYNIQLWWPILRLDEVFDMSPLEDEELISKIAETNGPGNFN